MQGCLGCLEREATRLDPLEGLQNHHCSRDCRQAATFLAFPEANAKHTVTSNRGCFDSIPSSPLQLAAPGLPVAIPTVQIESSGEGRN